MIDSEDIQTMLVEIATGKPPSLNTPEANRMRKKLIRECEEIRAKGGGIDVPWEIPDPS